MYWEDLIDSGIGISLITAIWRFHNLKMVRESASWLEWIAGRRGEERKRPVMLAGCEKNLSSIGGVNCCRRLLASLPQICLPPPSIIIAINAFLIFRVLPPPREKARRRKMVINEAERTILGGEKIFLAGGAWILSTSKAAPLPRSWAEQIQRLKLFLIECDSGKRGDESAPA